MMIDGCVGFFLDVSRAGLGWAGLDCGFCGEGHGNGKQNESSPVIFLGGGGGREANVWMWVWVCAYYTYLFLSSFYPRINVCTFNSFVSIYLSTHACCIHYEILRP